MMHSPINEESGCMLHKYMLGVIIYDKPEDQWSSKGSPDIDIWAYKEHKKQISQI